MARSLLTYGESGTYKTSNLGEIADYLCAAYGGPVRLVTADSGVGPVQDQIDRGVIEYWRITTCQNPLAMIRKVCRGHWPDKWIDAANGIADESSLVSKTSRDTGLIAGASGVMIEGLTMIASLISYDLVTRKQRATGEPLAAVFDEAGEKFADTSRGTYKFVQNQTFGYITELKGLACPWVVVTGHEGKGEDETNRRIYGPAVMGKAMTDQVCGWFENTLHFEKYMFQVKASGSKKGEVDRKEPGVRAFFASHQDPEVANAFWPAKLGVTPAITARIKDKWPNNYIPLLIDGQGVYASSVAKLVEMIDLETKKVREVVK